LAWLLPFGKSRNALVRNAGPYPGRVQCVRVLHNAFGIRLGGAALASLYRAEVIGSLLRPAYLKQARLQWESGQLSTRDFKRIEDRAVDEALAIQEQAGVDVVTDGEMRRTHFIAPLTDVISGLESIPAFKRLWKRPHDRNQPAEQTEIQVQYAVVSKIQRLRTLTSEEFTYARSRARKPLKVTLPSPLMLALRWSPQYSRDAYPDPFELFADAAEIVRREAQELAALGCEYIQIDAPELGMLCDPERRRRDFAEAGIDPGRLLSDGIGLLNSVATVPGVTFALHLCRGNNRGYYVGEGGYESVARQVFGRARNFAVLLLEYDDWRSGSFEPLRKIPPDKGVVLGLISTKRAELESVESIVARVEEAARYYPREQLALSTQCGFGTVWEGNPISEAIEAAKLRVVASIAHQLWPGGATSI
jgi:5-methyltetrahydropteroyltriglutamate--homocysteine methyltransferase